ncbi:hypothetical protein [Arthrobacter sp. KNU40]|uniref:hypothetical protein n=1 Tax=Arthrobacter sp. KNU40 TaxID=3447965 RepID=UPI003F607096
MADDTDVTQLRVGDDFIDNTRNYALWGMKVKDVTIAPVVDDRGRPGETGSCGGVTGEIINSSWAYQQ